MHDFSIDSIKLYEKTNYDTIVFQTDTLNNILKFAFFDCYTENSSFNTTITKKYLLKLNNDITDTINLTFKPIEPASECGGTDFEYVHINYYGINYNMNYHITTLNRP